MPAADPAAGGSGQREPFRADAFRAALKAGEAELRAELEKLHPDERRQLADSLASLET